jgi:hypothetical protein
MIEDNHMKIDPYNEEIWEEEQIPNEKNTGFWYYANNNGNVGLTGHGFIDESNEFVDLEESSLDTDENNMIYYKFEYKYQKNKNSFNKINKNPKIIINNIRKICNYHK